MLLKFAPSFHRNRKKVETALKKRKKCKENGKNSAKREKLNVEKKKMPLRKIEKFKRRRRIIYYPFLPSENQKLFQICIFRELLLCNKLGFTNYGQRYSQLEELMAKFLNKQRIC